MMVVEDTTLPFKIPSGWESTSVGDEFFLILRKMLDAEKNVGVPRPYLGNKSVQWGRIDTDDLSLIKLTPADLRRYRLVAGDLLVCEGGDIGRSAIWQGQLEECYFQKALHRVRPRGGYSPVLLRYLLELYSKTGFLLNFATQTSIAHLPKD
jgi:type I restriction enzyme S subunit